MRLRRSVRERIRWCKSDTLPGQTLKRKKWIVVSIVLICASFDVLLLFITEKAISPLLEDAPYLPKEYAQAYTHVATLRDESHRRLSNDINAIAFSPDGQTFAAGGHQELHLWDVSTGKPMSTFKDHQGWIHAVAFSPDGKTLANVSSKRGRSNWPLVILLDPLAPRHLVLHTIRLLDAKTGTTRLTFPVNTLPITALEFSSDSTKLLIVSEQGFIDVYDSATGHREEFSKPLFVHDAIRNTYGFNALAFSSDGKIFATGGRDRVRRGYDVAGAEIQLWSVDTGHLLHTFNSPGRWVNRLVFSPDGKTLASVGEDLWNKIFIWDLENHRLLSIITTHERAITALQFAPDSITLASFHSNGTVNLWDITGRTKR
jgi:WD40 repeat protein